MTGRKGGGRTRQKLTQIRESVSSIEAPSILGKRSGALRIERKFPSPGYIGTFDADGGITEDEIRDRWGAGRYHLTWYPPPEAESDEPIESTLQLADLPGGDKSATGSSGDSEMIRELMAELRDQRKIREAERADVQKSIIDHMGNAMQFQREIAQDALKQTILLMGEQQKATAQVFASMRQEQEQAFSRELQRRDSHTKETLVLMQSAVGKQGGISQITEVAEVAMKLRAAFPTDKSVIGDVLDHAGDIKELGSGIFEGVARVLEARNPKKPPPPKQLTATDGENAAAAALARAGDKLPPPPTAHDDGGNGAGEVRHAPADDDGDPDWEVFLGWLSLARKLPPEQTISLIQNHIDAGDLPVYLQAPLTELQRGNLEPLRQVFEAAGAVEVLEQVIETLKRMNAAAKAAAPGVSTGDVAGQPDPDVGSGQPMGPLQGDPPAGSIS